MPHLRFLCLVLLLLSLPVDAMLVNGELTVVGAINHCASTAGTDTYACNLSPVATTPGYNINTRYSFTADVANTGPATINFNGVGPKAIVKTLDGVSTALVDGDIWAGKHVTVIYDGTNMQCQNCDGNVIPIMEYSTDTLPETCRANRDLASITDATSEACQLQRCNASGTGWECVGSGDVSTTTGLRTSSTELLSSRWAVTEMSDTQQLCVHYRVNVTVGTNGANILLPSAADTNCGGEFKLIIIDTGTGSLIVTPDGTDTLLIGSLAMNESYPPLTGINNSLYIERISDTGWRVEEITSVGVGAVLLSGQDNTITNGTQDFRLADAVLSKTDPGYAPLTAAATGYDTTLHRPVAGINGVATTGLGGKLCSGTGGSTNSDDSGAGSDHNHSLTCVLEGNSLHAGTVLNACSIFAVTTPSAAGAFQHKLKLGASTVFSSNPQTTAVIASPRTATICFQIVIGGAPGASVTTYTGIIANLLSFDDGAAVNTVAQPVNVNTSTDLTLTFSTQWNANVAGANTYEQLAMYVLMFK